MTEENGPSSIAKRDWRLQAITTLTAPYHSPAGQVHPVGTPVELISPMLFEGETLIAAVANPPALFLSLAARLATSARPPLRALAHLKPTGSAKMKQAHEIGEETFFGALEDLIGCTVFSVTALEAFANEIIPDDFKHTALRNDGRCTEVFEKAQIERHLSLDAKLDQILPKIRMVPSPKGTELWDHFVAMHRLRDRLIHLKSSDMKPAEPGVADYLWSLLLTEKVIGFPRYAKEIMAHYYPADMPRWLRKCPV